MDDDNQENERDLGGRPEYVPTKEAQQLVRMMAATGRPQDIIAKVLKIAPNTLRKHFAEDLESAAEIANAKVASSMYKEATEGKGASKVSAGKYWLSCRAGWKETTAVQVSGEDGKPLMARSPLEEMLLRLSNIRANSEPLGLPAPAPKPSDLTGEPQPEAINVRPT